MIVTLNTSDNLMPDNHHKGTLNRINSLLKALKLCNEIQGNLLIRMMEKIITNSNTVSR